MQSTRAEEADTLTTVIMRVADWGAGAGAARRIRRRARTFSLKYALPASLSFVASGSRLSSS